MAAQNNQGRRPLFGPMSQAAYGLDWNRKLTPTSLLSSIDDAQGTAYDLYKNMGFGPTIFRGRVVDVIAYAHCYRVMLERQAGVVLCTALAAGGLMPLGPHPINSIAPGSEVYVLRPPFGDYGIILGVIPIAMTAPNLALSDFVHQASRCGLRVDHTHSTPFGCESSGGIADWSNGRPFDGMSMCEWGAITETGLRVLLDPFMVQLAVDEATGVFAFYHDQLLRLAGFNMQAFSGGHESEIAVDQAEVYHYDGFTPYPWEQTGVMVAVDDPFQDFSPQEVQISKPHYASWEPGEDDQQPFHRSLQFRGYLGQGGKRMIQAPYQDDAYTYSGDNTNLALFEENIGVDGRYSLRSAKSIHIVKWAAIPAVKRMKRCEDGNGDTDENYKFAGAVGDGPDHKITGEIEADSQVPHLQQVAGLMDVHAWVFNWLGAHPFFYHKKDWNIAEEEDTFIGMVEAPITFGDLAGNFYLNRPDPVQQKIDHRLPGVSYFPNHSYLSMQDDGGVVLGDGYGAEIRMCGGHIFLTAPGDIWAKPGRNFNALGGHDIILRANNSMDLSTTKKDLRLKAEHNLHLLGGNAGDIGGVLIECKAPGAYDYQDKVGEEVGSGGFQVKVDHGDAVIWATNIYLRTGGGDVQPGTITLDAAKGQQVITMQASSILNYVSNSITDNFGSDGNIVTSHVWGAQSNIIGSEISVEGWGIFLGGILALESFLSVAGYFGSPLAQDYDGKVGTIIGESLELDIQDLETVIDDEAKAVAAVSKNWQLIFANWLYADKGAGNDDTISAVHFTFRNPQQYLTTNFKLFEDRWQQMARLSGQELKTWEETAVTGGSSEETMPYPGKEPWDDDDTYMRMDLSLYDHENGVSKSRKDNQNDYEQPKFKDPDPQPPSQGYLIIV
jgi:hypothetical protein